MDQYYRVIFYILTAVLGLCVGSFLNVVIYRVPQHMSLAKPRSHCTSCGYVLHWYDNIPVLSYLLLGGKCRKCKAHISLRYTIVELANMLLWLACAALFADTSIPLACIYMAICSVFICVFYIDLEHQLIFDRFQIILLVLAVASIFFDSTSVLSHILGGVIGFAVFYLISLGFEKLVGKEGLGGGDVKLAGVAGLLLGWERLVFAILVATLPAAVIMLLASRGKEGEQRQFPFAPFLVVGFTASMFFGSAVIEWYLSLLGVSGK